MSITTKKLYVVLEEASEVVSLAPSTIQKMVTRGEFPAPRKLADRRVGWLVRELEEWAEARPVSDLLPPKNTGKRSTQQETQDARQAA